MWIDKPQAEAVTTVSPGIARLYHDHFGVRCHCILNVPPFEERYRLGVVAPDFQPQTMARCLNQLTTQQIRAFKQ